MLHIPSCNGISLLMLVVDLGVWTVCK